MADTKTQITAEELKKKLNESSFPEDLKTAYLEVLNEMTDEEKTELAKVIETYYAAEEEHEKQRLEKLAHLNKALKKHLQNSAHEEKKYIREQIESFGHEKEDEEMKEIEQEINDL